MCGGGRVNVSATRTPSEAVHRLSQVVTVEVAGVQSKSSPP